MIFLGTKFLQRASAPIMRASGTQEDARGGEGGVGLGRERGISGGGGAGEWTHPELLKHVELLMFCTCSNQEGNLLSRS